MYFLISILNDCTRMKKILFALSLTALVSGAAFADGGKGTAKKASCCAKMTTASSCCQPKARTATAKVAKADAKPVRKKA